jgi:hypothetical protein
MTPAVRELIRELIRGMKMILATLEKLEKTST